MASKQGLKQGEKVLFGIFGAFLVAAIIAYIGLEIVRYKSEKPLFEISTHFDFSEAGKRGSQIFREARCTSCHRAVRNGTNMGLSLDGVGSKRTREWLYQFLADPEKTYGQRTLDHGLAPKEAAYVATLPEADRRDLAAFLSELTADRGSASSPLPPEGKSEFIDNMLKMVAPEGWKEKYQDVRQQDSETTQTQ